ncbi:MAG: radical SAM protein [bacterium]
MKEQSVVERAKESPEYLRMSLAAAITLGFRKGFFYRGAELHCVNLLMTYKEGCLGNCAYCGLSKERNGRFDDKSFIRVEWPVYSLDEILDAIDRRRNWVERICVSMITNKRAVEDLKYILRRLAERFEIPTSLLITPTILSREALKEFKGLGAERIGVAVDAATPELFQELRGRQVRGPHRWERYWGTIRDSIDIFGRGYVGVHLIVGLGETEKEMIEAIQRVRDLGGSTHLFSFYPEAGSQLESHPQPPAGKYRRVQLARYLIDNGMARVDDMAFDPSGRIVDFGLRERELSAVIDSGKPFMTSGCPGKDGDAVCTRPFGDSPPGPDIRSYPFALNEEDIAQVRSQLTS